MLLAGSALALAGFAVSSNPVQAVNGCSGPGTITYYYNNAAHSQVVGTYQQNCNSTVCTGQGAVTQYSEVFYLSCPPPGGGA
jgi:hypothetical protein